MSVPMRKDMAVATTLLPYRKDDIRAKYLGYLCCGFSDEEALYALSMTYSWLERMRQDAQFSQLEMRIPELRKELCRDYTEMDFFRNFRMIMEKDHRVLRKALDIEVDEETGEPAELTPFEEQYLLKIRSVYTPQQLQLIEAVAGNADSFNFAQWVSRNQDKIVSVSRTDKLTIRGSDGSEETYNSEGS